MLQRYSISPTQVNYLFVLVVGGLGQKGEWGYMHQEPSRYQRLQDMAASYLLTCQLINHGIQGFRFIARQSVLATSIHIISPCCEPYRGQQVILMIGMKWKAYQQLASHDFHAACSSPLCNP